jgi:hypothetical protein
MIEGSLLLLMLGVVFGILLQSWWLNKSAKPKMMKLFGFRENTAKKFEKK